MMRSPGAAFDLRSALVDEVRSALDVFNDDPAQPKNIHRCRVALKRARALVEVGRIGAPGLADVFNDAARAIMRVLGHARDEWVIARSARDLSDRVGRKARKQLKKLAERIESDPQAARLDTEVVRARLNDLLALAQVWPDTSTRQVERGVRQVARRAHKVWRQSRASKKTCRHRWRKREKARLYAASLLRTAWSHGEPRRRKQNAALGQVLGDAHDLAMLMDRLAAEPTNTAKRDLHAVRKRLVKRADKLGRRLHARNS